MISWWRSNRAPLLYGGLRENSADSQTGTAGVGINHNTPPDESMSDEQLIEYKNHFAVQQPFKNKADAILLSREKKDADRRHIESINVSRDANKLSKWALIISAFSLIVSVIALYKPNKDLKTELQKIKTESDIQSKVVSQSSNTSHAKQQKLKSKSMNNNDGKHNFIHTP